MTHVRRSRMLWLVVTVVGAIAVVGCGSGGASVESARTYAVETVRARDALAQRSDVYRHLDELLPNVSFRAPSGREIRAVRAAVVGRIVDTAEGAGYVDGETRSRLVPFDAPGADWRSVKLKIDVDEVLGGDPLEIDDSIWVGFSIGTRTDATTFRKGMRNLGTVVMFLDPPGFFRDDRTAYIVHEGGALTGRVDSTGVITFPMREEQPGFMGSIRTLADLRAAASAPRRTIEVDAEQAYLFGPEA